MVGRAYKWSGRSASDRCDHLFTSFVICATDGTLLGAISDSSRSRYRRRYWVVTSTIALVISTLVLAYCKEIAAIFVSRTGSQPSNDAYAKDKVIEVAIGFAVAAFYLLDFSLNALQASLRNLLLDITPPSQLNSGNAWHGRMTHAGNIVGYGFGMWIFAFI